MEFKSAISNPCNPNSLFVGTKTGKLIKIDFNDSFQEINREIIIENFENIMNLFYLSSNEVLILCTGSIDVYNCERLSLETIKSDSDTIFSAIVLNENQFVVFGKYGYVWNFKRIGKENAFIEEITSNFGDHAHFGVGVYNTRERNFIANNYYGWNRVFTEDMTIVRTIKTEGNLQALYIEDNNIFGPDYNGNMFLFSPSSILPDYFQTIECVDCEDVYRTPSKMIKIGSYIYSGFSKKIWRFNISFTDKKIYNLEREYCKDLVEFNSKLLILTNSQTIFPKPDEFIDSEDHLDFKYINVGILGHSIVGKSSLAKKICTGYYDSSTLGTTTGVLNWNYTISDEKTVYFIDIPGQKDIVRYYLPEFSWCQLVLILIEKRNSIAEVTETFQNAKYLYSKFPLVQFIIVRTKSDEKTEITTIKDLYELADCELAEIPYYDEIIEVSAQNNYNIEILKQIIQNHEVWINACRVMKSKVSKKILDLLTLRTGMGREEIFLFKKHSKGETLEELLEKSEHILSKSIIENAVQKLASERRLHLLNPSDGKFQILLKTELLAMVQSRIITKISISQGYIYLERLKEDLISNYGGSDPIKIEKIKIFQKEFIDYLVENSFMKVVYYPTNNNLLIMTDKLRSVNTPSDKFVKMSFKFQNPISVDTILSLFLPKGKIEVITTSDCLISFPEGDKIYLRKLDLFNSNSLSQLTLGIYYESNYNDSLFRSAITTLSNHGFQYLPELESDYTPGSDYNEKVKFCLNNPSEGPFWDFKEKREVSKISSTKWNRSAMKFLKSVVSLGNSGIYNDNEAYLLIGVGEVDYNTLKIVKVNDIAIIEQKMSQLINHFLTPCHIIPHRILISHIKDWHVNEEINTNLNFNPSIDLDDQILFIIIKRIPKSIIEFKKNFRYKKTSVENDTISRGWSMIRSFSFSYGLSTVERNLLLGI